MAAPEKRFVLLVGCSAAGKSALGNFLQTGKSQLVTSDDASDLGPFAVGDGIQSTTYSVDSASVAWECDGKRFEVTIIDTPGLDDSQNRDEVHIIDIFRTMVDIRSGGNKIGLVCVVVNARRSHDQKFRSAHRAVVSLLGAQLMENAALVYTCVNHDDPHRLQEAKGSARAYSRDLAKGVQLDDDRCVPYCMLNSKFGANKPKSCENAHMVRAFLLNAACRSDVQRMTMLALPKTDRWRRLAAHARARLHEERSRAAGAIVRHRSARKEAQQRAEDATMRGDALRDEEQRLLLKLQRHEDPELLVPLGEPCLVHLQRNLLGLGWQQPADVTLVRDVPIEEVVADGGRIAWEYDEASGDRRRVNVRVHEQWNDERPVTVYCKGQYRLACGEEVDRLHEALEKARQDVAAAEREQHQQMLQQTTHAGAAVAKMQRLRDELWWDELIAGGSSAYVYVSDGSMSLHDERKYLEKLRVAVMDVPEEADPHAPPPP